MSKPPNCEKDGCSNDSQYLLPCGDRCEQHARAENDQLVRFMEKFTQ